MQLAYHVDPTFDLNQIVFSAEDFKDKIRNLPKHKALIWDESFKGLSSKGSLTKENRKIVTLLQECRQRNLFIFIVLPTIFLLEKYAAIFRSHALFHVTVFKKNFKLRYFRIYNYQKKKLLYILGKTLMDYAKPRVKKSYRFYGKLPPTVDKEEYIAKKLESFRQSESKREEDTKPIRQRNYLFYILNKNYGLNYVQIEELLKKVGLDIDATVIGRHIRGTSQKMQNA